ncbi:hypothetical protein HNP52_000053 [Sphingomonas kyeonggiensis]|uniref:Uncharacterized protein n=1 Tax=Sphingomonas kyeonggiensis TaxID=1268553 RepID=A0A7W7NQQ9_9SPHN|nr:hypothetical protein [Sphingomonas kyeonggiensis]
MRRSCQGIARTGAIALLVIRWNQSEHWKFYLAAPRRSIAKAVMYMAERWLGCR